MLGNLTRPVTKQVGPGIIASNILVVMTHSEADRLSTMKKIQNPVQSGSKQHHNRVRIQSWEVSKQEKL